MSNRLKTAPETPNYVMRRLLVIAGIGLVGLMANKGVETFNDVKERHHFYDQLASPDAMQTYLQGDIDPSKVTIVKAEEGLTVWEFAKKLRGEGDPRTLADIMTAQDEASSVPGVQAGESFLVPVNQLEHPEAYPNPMVDTDPTRPGVQ